MMNSRNWFGVIVFMIFFALLGCSSKYGHHKLEYIESQAKPDDGIYEEFLIEQIDNEPHTTVNYIKLAEIYLSQNKTTKAFRVLDKGEQANPEDVDVLVGLANIYLQQNNVKSLSNLLDRIRKIDAENVGFLQLSSGYECLMNNYTNALFFANRAILINPYDDKNLYLRGKAQLLQQDSANALISLEEAMDLNGIYKNFSIVFDVALSMGLTDKAKQYLDEFVAKDPLREMCYEWGAYYNEISMTDTAKAILLRCIQKDGYDPRVDYELAKIYNHKLNGSDSAIYYVDKYIFGNYEPLSGYVLKAEILDKSKKYNEALESYNTAIELDSTYVPAQKGLNRLQGKLSYLWLIKRKENVQRETQELKPLGSKEIN